MQRGRCCAVGAVVDAGTGHSSPNRTRAAPDVQCVCGIARACVCVCEAPPRSGFTGEYRTVAHEAEWMFRAARAHARILDSPAAVWSWKLSTVVRRTWCDALQRRSSTHDVQRVKRSTEQHFHVKMREISPGLRKVCARSAQVCANRAFPTRKACSGLGDTSQI